MKKSSKLIKGLLLLLLTLTLIGTQIRVPEAYAADPAPAAEEEAKEAEPLLKRLQRDTLQVEANATETTDTKKLVEQAAQVAQYVNNIFNPLIHFFTFKIGAFLNNDYIYAGGMGQMLQNIWRMSRNMVNIVFVLILLFLALKQIVKGDDSTDLKKVLPVFALTLIAVNFSWLASKVVLDASNVMTNVTFAIPSAVKGTIGDKVIAQDCGIEETDSGTGKLTGLCQLTKVYNAPSAQYVIHAKAEECEDGDIDKKYQEVYPEKGEGIGPGHLAYKEVFGKNIYCWKTMDLGAYSQNTASYFLSFSMARVQNLVRANAKDVGKLAIGSIMAFLIQIVYLVAFACLFIALILRIAALWLFVAFSPFIVLFIAMKTANLGTGGGLAEKISPQAFAHWAFAPAMVGAVWSVGFLMVSAGQSMSVDFFEKLNEVGEVTGRIYDVSTLFVGMEHIQQFVWLLMTVGIIWVGTFAVLTKLSFGKEIFDYVSKAGNKFADTIAKSPTWAPIVPLYDHETGKWKQASLEKIVDKYGPNKIIERYRQGTTLQESTKLESATKELTEALKKDAEKQKLQTILDQKDAEKAIQFIVTNSKIDATLLKESLKHPDKQGAVRTMLTTADTEHGEALYNLALKFKEKTDTAEPPVAGGTPAAPAPPAPAPGKDKAKSDNGEVTPHHP